MEVELNRKETKMRCKLHEAVADGSVLVNDMPSGEPAVLLESGEYWSGRAGDIVQRCGSMLFCLGDGCDDYWKLPLDERVRVRVLEPPALIAIR